MSCGEIYSADAPKSVRITQSRWEVRISIVTTDGQIRTFVASADSALTNHDGIFFGTEEEYRAELERWR